MGPLIVAPMAGGPTTTELVIAAARAGALGFLAAGYRTPAAVEDDLRAVGGVGRGLRNRFTDAYSAAAPVGYPAIHHLTAPIRAAAARLGDASALNLWAGTGFASARPGPVADLLGELQP